MADPAVATVDLAEALSERPPDREIRSPEEHQGTTIRRLPAPAGRWANTNMGYDPDKLSNEESFQVSAVDYAKRFAVLPDMDEATLKTEEAQAQYGVKLPTEPKPFIPVDVEGVVMMPVKESQRWRPVYVRNSGELKALHESASGADKRFMESFGDIDFDAGTDFPGNASPFADRLWNREFIPIMGGPFNKQLYIYDYLLMHARAFEMCNHNVLTACAIKIMERFTVGRGISYHIKDPDVKEVWDEFWDRNNMRDKFRQCARDLPWQGELMIRTYEKQEGHVSLRVLDPSTCWEVVTDPEDFEHVYYYHFQWPTPYQIWVSGQIPVAKYIIQQIPPTNIIHLKINVSSQEKRGRSSFLPAFPWVKRFNDFYNGQTVKAVLEANLVFKIKIKGDQADVDAFLQNSSLTELPPPGGTWVENEAVDLQATSTALTSGGRGNRIGQELAAAFAASVNLPNEYFNIESGGGGARATALVRTDPAVKSIEDHQQRLTEIGEQVYDRVIASAINAGRLDISKARKDPEVNVDDDTDENNRRPVRSQLIRTVRGR